MNCRMADAFVSVPLLLEFDVLPRIGVARSDRGKHVLPPVSRDARTDGVHESMAKNGYHVVILQDCALDLLGQPLALSSIDRRFVAVELSIECRYAHPVGAIEAAAPDDGHLSVRPCSHDARSLHNHLDGG